MSPRSRGLPPFCLHNLICPETNQGCERALHSEAGPRAKHPEQLIDCQTGEHKGEQNGEQVTDGYDHATRPMLTRSRRIICTPYPSCSAREPTRQTRTSLGSGG